MVNEVQPRQIELTARGINPTLNKEVSLYMADGKSREVVQPEQASNIGPQPTVKPNAEQLRSEWNSAFSPRDMQNPDTRTTIEAAIELGFSPQRITSKGKAEQTAEDVVKTSLIDKVEPGQAARFKELLEKESLSEEEKTELLKAHPAHLVKEEEILGRKLSEDEQIAILKAHYSSYGEKGKDGNPAGVFNLTQKQIAKEARILKEAGFDKDQRREIIESGLAGTPPPVDPILALLGLTITDPRLRNIRDSLVDQRTTHPDNLDEELLVGVNKKINEVQAGEIEKDPGARDQAVIDRAYDLKQAIGETISAQKEAERIAQTAAARARGEVDPMDILLHQADELENQIKALDRIVNGMPAAPGALAVPGRPLDPAEQNLYDNLLEQRKNTLYELVGRAQPSAEAIHREVWARLYRDDDALKYLFNNIITYPMGQETENYRLGFYADINLTGVLTHLKARSERAYGNAGEMQERNKDRAFYQSLSLRKESVEAGHNANLQIVTTGGATAEVISRMRAAYSQVLNGEKGAAAIQRWLETEALIMNSSRGFIASDDVNEAMGRKTNKDTGEIEADQEKAVRTRFIKYVDDLKERRNALGPGYVGPGALTPEQLELTELRPWQMDAAYEFGKILHFVNLRQTEHVAWGMIREGWARYASVHGEFFARILNPIEVMFDRFDVSENIGGKYWLGLWKKRFQERRDSDGYGKTRIKKVAGRDIKTFESPAMLKVAGMYAGWRVLQVFARIPWEADDGTQTNLAAYLESRGERVVGKRSLWKKAKMLATKRDYNDPDQTVKDDIKLKDEDAPASVKIADLKQTYLHNGQLRPELTSSLGLILTERQLSPSAHDSEEVRKTKFKIRTAIWSKVAQDNPIAMAAYVHGTQLEGGIECNVFHAKDASGNPVYIDKLSEEKASNPVWESLRGKLFYYHETRMNRIKNGGYAGYVSLDDILAEENSLGVSPYKLDPAETALLGEIRTNGGSLAPELATLRFGFMPFINDVLFEHINYEELGPDAIRRRLVNDMGQFQEAQNALIGIMDNPGGVKPEQAADLFSKARSGYGAVHGTETGQQLIADGVIAYAEIVETGGTRNKILNNGVQRFLRKQPIYSGAKQFFRMPNSIAQELAGMEAETANELELFRLAEKMLHIGVFNRETKKKFDKRFGGFFKILFATLFRDIIPLIMIGAMVEITKRGFTDVPELKSS